MKWVRCFEQNCIVKWVIFFASLWWLWDFLLENLKWKKIWWCSLERVDEYKKLYVWIIFSKKNSKYEIFNHLYFGPNFVFWWTALGRFIQFFFGISLSANHGGHYFYSALPPHHKNGFYGPVSMFYLAVHWTIFIKFLHNLLCKLFR